eukprot:511530-Prymnesium_polylepis.1
MRDDVGRYVPISAAELVRGFFLRANVAEIEKGFKPGAGDTRTREVVHRQNVFPGVGPIVG